MKSVNTNHALSIVIVNFVIISFCACIQVSERCFPRDFLFGAASAAYQIEGGWNETDKGVNIWDDFTHNHPERIVGGANGDIAADSYHFYQKDIFALRDLGANTYSFSISWSRLLPTGFIDVISPSGTKYYNDLIDLLLLNGITPIVTLYYWDTPEPLQRIGGFTNEEVVNLFVDYAQYCFEQFGDRVKYWVTFDEINKICSLGYKTNKYAPAVNLPGVGEYLCAHNMILAHAKTYRLYDDQYRLPQKGQVGLAHQVPGYYPYSSKKEHVDAANLAQDFITGWIVNPIFSKDGDYPQSMKSIIRNRSLAENYKRSRLPEFTPEEIKLVRGSADFLGVNHYSTLIFTVENLTDTRLVKPADVADLLPYDLTLNTYQLTEWPVGGVTLNAVVPEGFRSVLQYIKTHYGNPPIIITGNGIPTLANYTDLNDYLRVEYLNKYLSALLTSIISDGVDCRGYVHLALIDGFLWSEGYSYRYGLYSVNFASPTKERCDRLSSRVYRRIIETGKIDYNYLPIINNDAICF